MSDVVVLIGNPRAGSRTRTLADALTTAVLAELTDRGVTLDGVRTLELADLTAITFGVAAAPAAPEPDALDAVFGARLLVVATPSYKGSYTGLLKVFLDQVPHQGLAGIVAVPVAAAASPDHLRATADDLARLLGELGARVPAGPIAVGEDELADPVQAAADRAPQIADAIAAALVSSG